MAGIQGMCERLGRWWMMSLSLSFEGLGAESVERERGSKVSREWRWSGVESGEGSE